MTTKYPVKLKSVPKGHSLPPLLAQFGTWLATQPHGSVGFFELVASAVPGPFGDADFEQLKRDAWCFGSLPDGSLLALIDSVKPAPVVIFGSEGEHVSVAPTFEAFLFALAASMTRVADLDEENEPSKRSELATWLTHQKVNAPAAAKFNLKAYFKRAQAVPPRASSKVKLPPNIKALVALLGRPAIDESLGRALVALGLKWPRKPSTDFECFAAKQGIGAVVKKGVLVEVVLKEPYAQKLPFKLEFSGKLFWLKKLLGKPVSQDKGPNLDTTWQKPLDDAGRIFFVHSRGHVEPNRTVRLQLRDR